MRQSSEWFGEPSPRPKKLKFQRPRTKTMSIHFFSDSQGVRHKEFVPEGKTENSTLRMLLRAKKPNWWIKEGQKKKRNLRQLFRNCTTAQKPVYMPIELILNEKGMCLPHVSSIVKKISPKTFGPHCVFLFLHRNGTSLLKMPRNVTQRFDLDWGDYGLDVLCARTIKW